MTTTLISGADASTPTTPYPYPGPGKRILAAYVGAPDLPGPPDTPHIWTRDQWNRQIPTDAHGNPNQDYRLLPLYVHSFPGDPAADAKNLVDAVTDLGWTPHIGRLTCLDIETLNDPAYVTAVWEHVRSLGFRMLVYGSRLNLEKTPACDGRFVADLVRFRPRSLPPTWVGQQWQWGAWDLDVFSEFVWENCGHGFRRNLP